MPCNFEYVNHRRESNDTSIFHAKEDFCFTRASGKCAYCGHALSIERMHIDHIKPKKCGGNNDLSNLNCSCGPCNTAKGDRDLEDHRLQVMIKNPHSLT